VRALVQWYRKSARDLAFRGTQDPWRILVAEVVLQQTRVEQGAERLARFLDRYPDPAALAGATDDEVLREWEGLGYYRRATNLRKAAVVIVESHGGKVPSTVADLRALPGVGPYTAGAVASIAFGAPVPAVDGNAARVLARLFMMEETVGTAGAARRLDEHALSLHGSADPGAINQALMELGSLVCTPRDPHCGDCPVSRWCQARAAGEVGSYPVRPQSRALPEVEVAFAIVEWEGRVLAVRRKQGALLSGLWSLPGGELGPSETFEGAARRHLREWGVETTGLEEVSRQRKVFSSRVWQARVFRAKAGGSSPGRAGALWLAAGDLERVPFVPFHREILARIGVPLAS
jgi:A/G-specific adenine glycosylase